MKVDANMFGSIPGRTAQEALVTLQSLADNHRLILRNMTEFAGSSCLRWCYVDLAVQLQLMAVGLCRILRRMKHYIRTLVGIFPG